jgi:hypothetical protein
MYSTPYSSFSLSKPILQYISVLLSGALHHPKGRLLVQVIDVDLTAPWSSMDKGICVDEGKFPATLMQPVRHC